MATRWTGLIAALMAVATTIGVWGHAPRLTARGRLVAAQERAAGATVSAFVTLDRADDALLRDNGVRVTARMGDMAAITLSADRLDAVASLPGVSLVSPAQRLTLCNDTARSLSRADSVRLADLTSLTPFTGRGVVVGVVDVGFDFNHINFKDEHGNSRVARVYMPCDHTGEAPVVQGETLPGSHYTTPEQIAALTTDDTSTSHGTHTAGTAAGSYRANGLHGIAPDATLVLCGMPDDSLTDVNVALAVKYIFDYADHVGLPAVVNMSIGSHDGAHDGTSELCRALDAMSGPGKICVVSAGNDGAMGCHLQQTFWNATDTLRTFFADWSPASPIFYGSASAWSSTQAEHTVHLGVWDIKADTLCLRQQLVFPTDDEALTIDCDNDKEWSRYFTGKIEAAAGLDAGDRYHSIVDVRLYPVDAEHYRLTLHYTAPRTTTIHAWTGVDSYFYHYDLDGWKRGTSFGSISDLATGDNTLSAGAYCSRNNIATDWGDVISWTRCKPYQVAHFSSRGPDQRGIMRPDVLAPGFALVSSASRYDPKGVIANARRVTEVTVDGVTYPYGAQDGTSMATPVVTGAVALCLQADPTLTAARLRKMLAATAVVDDAVRQAPPEQAGNGKLDVMALLRHAAREAGDVNADGVCNGADITTTYNAILSTEPPAWGTPARRDLIYDWLLSR